MTDDLMKRLRDAVNGGHDMTPHGADCLQAADRIEELEAQLKNMSMLWAKADVEKQTSLGRIEELEKELEYWRRDSAAGWDKYAEYRNKVEKVVEDAFFAGFSEGCDGTWVEGDPTPAFKEYLAELKGEK